MAREMVWSSETGLTQFLGRNGYFRCKGFRFERICSLDAKWCEDAVRIYPVTSKENIGRCFIEIPASRIGHFLRALKREARQVGKEST